MNDYPNLTTEEIHSMSVYELKELHDEYRLYASDECYEDSNVITRQDIYFEALDNIKKMEKK